MRLDAKLALVDRLVYLSYIVEAEQNFGSPACTDGIKRREEGDIFRRRLHRRPYLLDTPYAAGSSEGGRPQTIVGLEGRCPCPDFGMCLGPCRTMVTEGLPDAKECKIEMKQ